MSTRSSRVIPSTLSARNRAGERTKTLKTYEPHVAIRGDMLDFMSKFSPDSPPALLGRKNWKELYS